MGKGLFANPFDELIKMGARAVRDCGVWAPVCIEETLERTAAAVVNDPIAVLKAMGPEGAGELVGGILQGIVVGALLPGGFIVELGEVEVAASRAAISTARVGRSVDDVIARAALGSLADDVVVDSARVSQTLTRAETSVGSVVDDVGAVADDVGAVVDDIDAVVRSARDAGGKVSESVANLIKSEGGLQSEAMIRSMASSGDDLASRLEKFFGQVADRHAASRQVHGDRNTLNMAKPTSPGPAAVSRASSSAEGSGDLYVAHNTGEGGGGLLAELGSDGILDLVIKRTGTTPSGFEMFMEALAHFGDRVKGVRGTWLGGGALADNFNSFTAAVQKGASLENAVFQTFTGKMAQRFGFTNARIVMSTSKKVVVEFTR